MIFNIVHLCRSRFTGGKNIIRHQSSCSTHQRRQPLKDVHRNPVVNEVDLPTLQKNTETRGAVCTVLIVIMLNIQLCNMDRTQTTKQLIIFWFDLGEGRRRPTETRSLRAVRASAANMCAVTRLSTWTQFIRASGSPNRKVNSRRSTLS